MQNSNYNKNLKPLSEELRNNSTFGEVILWSKVLKTKKMMNYQFNRQFSMKIDDLNIIVDFVCRKLKLVIEIDGFSHNFKYEEDKIRDEKLSKYGYVVLRIAEKDVKYDLDNVVRLIENAISEIENQSCQSP
jgi:very-short-patch-repair endonuclease